MQKLLRYYVRLFLVLLPLFFFPLSTDAYGAVKGVFLVVGAVIGLGLWTIQVVVEKKVEVKVSPWLWLWVLWGLWSILSWTKLPLGVQSKSWFQGLGLGTMVALAAWSWLFTQVNEKGEGQKQALWLSVGAVVLVVLSLVVFLIPVSRLPLLLPKTNPLITISSLWSLSGTIITELVLFLLLLGWWLITMIKRYQKGESYLVSAVLTAVMGLGVFLDSYRLLKSGVIWLDLGSSWVIAVEAFKQSPLWGVGLGNFTRAFEAFRPTSFNLTPLWAQGEPTGSGLGILHIWTELGIVGLGLMVAALLMVLRGLRKGWRWVLLLVVMLVSLWLPLQLLSMILIVWLGSVLFDRREQRLVLLMGEGGLNILPGIVGLLLVVGLGVVGYKGVEAVRANYYYYQSLLAASKNDGGGVYQWQIKAIGVDPNMPEYRRAYSQTNLALATVLLSQKELNDTDKQKVSVLLQQSVREAKAAVALDGSNAAYWANLAAIYRSIVGVVDGAPDWAMQAYQQAVALDPVNPLVRLDMGGLYYAAGNYDQADRTFEQVVLAKQDLANAWYNWAYSAKQLNKLADAVQRLDQAVALVSPTSGDYDKATKELSAWKAEFDAATKKAQAAAQVTLTPTPTPTRTVESLQSPQPLPTVGKEQKVNVKASDFKPPAITPMATPTLLPTPAPTGAGGP